MTPHKNGHSLKITETLGNFYTNVEFLKVLPFLMFLNKLERNKVFYSLMFLFPSYPLNQLGV